MRRMIALGVVDSVSPDASTMGTETVAVMLAAAAYDPLSQLNHPLHVWMKQVHLAGTPGRIFWARPHGLLA